MTQGPLFAVRHDLDAARRNALRHVKVHRGACTPFPQCRVVLGGAARVAVALDQHEMAGMLHEPPRTGFEDRRVDGADVRRVESKWMGRSASFGMNSAGAGRTSGAGGAAGATGAGAGGAWTIVGGGASCGGTGGAGAATAATDGRLAQSGSVNASPRPRAATTIDRVCALMARQFSLVRSSIAFSPPKPSALRSGDHRTLVSSDDGRRSRAPRSRQIRFRSQFTDKRNW